MIQGGKTAETKFRTVFDSIVAFPPNRDTMGGTAYFIILENGENILVDCPAWADSTRQFLMTNGGVRWLFLTHRGGVGQVQEFQKTFNCEVVVQEQEAYLLPEVSITPFRSQIDVTPSIQGIWTPGYSPGSACLYDPRYGGMLFSGRHLLPDLQGAPQPLRISKTFHWPRQIRSVRALLERFDAHTLQHICPGANTGFLRGARTIDQGYERLAAIDLDACLQAQPLL